MSELKAVRRLDLTGEVCPWPVMLTLKELRKMGNDEILEVVFDNPPSSKNIPEAVSQEGHQVLETGKLADGVFRIVIKAKKSS